MESSLIAEIIAKKNNLKRMDNMKTFSNTKSEVETIEEKQFIVFDDWYIVYYQHLTYFYIFNIVILI